MRERNTALLYGSESRTIETRDIRKNTFSRNTILKNRQRLHQSRSYEDVRKRTKIHALQNKVNARDRIGSNI
jgi:hypothetical protein